MTEMIANARVVGLALSIFACACSPSGASSAPNALPDPGRSEQDPRAAISPAATPPTAAPAASAEQAQTIMPPMATTATTTAGSPAMPQPPMSAPTNPQPAMPASTLPDLVFNMSGRIEAGAEAMFCMYVQMPRDVKTAIPSAESHYTPGSHHFLAYRTSLSEIPEGQGVSHLCGEPDQTVAMLGGANGLQGGESARGNLGSYYEAQVPNSRRDLPDGVAHVFQPGEILSLTAHYLNVSDREIDSQIEFRLHRMDPDRVKVEAGTFFLLNTQLNIPPHMQVTTTRSCPITQDLKLAILWSHMHARGDSFRAWTDDPVATAQLGGDIYTEKGPAAWEDPHVQNYPADPPIILHAGSNLMISCTYRNTTSQTFRFGLSAASAEMCLLHGMYWPRLDSATERCTNGVTMSEKPIPLGED